MLLVPFSGTLALCDTVPYAYLDSEHFKQLNGLLYNVHIDNYKLLQYN